MVSLVLVGEKNRQEQWDAAKRVLDQRCPAAFVRKGQLELPQEPAAVTVCDWASFQSIDSKHSIVLFYGGSCPPVKKIPVTHGIAVVNSCDEKALLRAGETKLPAITCGLSSRDTVTLSSMGVDDAVVNLQRSIQCFDGTVVEPQEFPVRLAQPMDHFLLMALSAVVVLCGGAAGLSGATL